VKRTGLVLLLLSLPGPVRADDALCGLPLDAGEVEARLVAIDEMLQPQEMLARAWWGSFIAVHAGMAVMSLGVVLVTDSDGTRTDYAVSGISSALGVVSLLFIRPPVLGASGELQEAGGQSDLQRERTLRALERRLRSELDAADFLFGPLAALGTVAYGAAASVTLLAAFDRRGSAVGFAVGTAIVGNARLLLRPATHRARWEAYLARYPDAGCRALPPPPPAARLQAVPLGLRLRF
jgi:hypothetical protein